VHVSNANVRYAVAGFFSDGKMLAGLKFSSESLTDMYKVFMVKVIDIAMQRGGWQVAARSDIDDAEACEGSSKNRRWLEWGGEHLCFGLVLYDKPGKFYTHATTDFYDMMKEKYEISLVEFYNAAADCAVNGEDGTPDEYAIPGTEQDIPTCWINIKTRKMEIVEDCQQISGNFNGPGSIVCNDKERFEDF